MAKICAMKVEKGIIEMKQITMDIPVDTSIEKCMKEIKETIKNAKKLLIRNRNEYKPEYNNIKIDSKSPIFEAVRMTPISELDYII